VLYRLQYLHNLRQAIHHRDLHPHLPHGNPPNNGQHDRCRRYYLLVTKVRSHNCFCLLWFIYLLHFTIPRDTSGSPQYSASFSPVSPFKQLGITASKTRSVFTSWIIFILRRGVNITTDLLLVFLPLLTIWKSHMPKAQRVAECFA
jgi:hypothetical protein